MVREEEYPVAPPVLMSEMMPSGYGMAVAFQGYYDGTGSPPKKDRGEIIGLAGYAAAPAIWDQFEAEWWRVLADDSQRPACRYSHMNEANALRGEFSPEKGWDHKRVGVLISDLFNRCFSPYGRHDLDPAQVLVGSACSVELDAYERVCKEYPHFKAKEPEALCVDHVIGTGITQLVPSDVEGMHLHELVQRRRSIALYFDRNERFRHYIHRVWSPFPWHRRTKVLKLIHSIGETDREASAALQAADFLAWHTNRNVASGGGDMKAKLIALFSARCDSRHYDYEDLRSTAARWRPGEGYGAVPDASA